MESSEAKKCPMDLRLSRVSAAVRFSMLLPQSSMPHGFKVLGCCTIQESNHIHFHFFHSIYGREEHAADCQEALGRHMLLQCCRRLGKLPEFIAKKLTQLSSSEYIRNCAAEDLRPVNYMVGGQSFNAAEIEFVILKMKNPAHRPHISLMLALYQFRITEEHKKYLVDDTEPMVLFALSSRMLSSSAIRIFSAEKVRLELQESMRDYIRASVGISDKGKFTVPALLQSYAKGAALCSRLDMPPADSRPSGINPGHYVVAAPWLSQFPHHHIFRYLFFPDRTDTR